MKSGKSNMNTDMSKTNTEKEEVMDMSKEVELCGSCNKGEALDKEEYGYSESICGRCVVASRIAQVSYNETTHQERLEELHHLAFMLGDDWVTSYESVAGNPHEYKDHSDDCYECSVEEDEMPIAYRAFTYPLFYFHDYPESQVSLVETIWAYGDMTQQLGISLEEFVDLMSILGLEAETCDSEELVYTRLATDKVFHALTDPEPVKAVRDSE